jgi:hypothetical protein
LISAISAITELETRVIVFDGKVETAFDEEIFCGQKSPPPFISTSRDLHIKLKQSLQDHGKGVKIMCGFTATKEPSSNIRARPTTGSLVPKIPSRIRPVQVPVPQNTNRAPAFEVSVSSILKSLSFQKKY